MSPIAMFVSLLERTARGALQLGGTEMTSGLIVEEIGDDEPFDPEHPIEKAVASFRNRSLTAKRRSQAVERAARDWPVVKSDTDWAAVCVVADDDYADGAFLIRQLGGESALDPGNVATLLGLRERIIGELHITAAHELMLADLAIASYFNALRVQRWIGDLAFVIEHQFFGLDQPTGRYRPRQKLADGLTVEEHVVRLRDQLMPLVDRANRMLIRNLKAIKELRQAEPPPMAINQLNIGDRQVNIALSRKESIPKRKGV